MRKQLLILIALLACGFLGYLNYHNCVGSADLSIFQNLKSPGLSNLNINTALPKRSCRIKGFFYRDNESERV